jgi:dTDP-4-dehydrorhamnose 3,5-epimerase
MTASPMPGVRFGTVVRHGDARGSFREIWRAGDLGPIDPALAGAPAHATPEFVQANLSSSAAGVLRGLHLHRRQLDRWLVVSGRAFVALVDVRPMLAGGPAPEVVTHELGPDDWVEIPAGVAHGFLALEPLELLYFVTNTYDGTDELGFAWDDPIAAVPWPPHPGTPAGRPILSERDESNPPLRDLVERLRATR